MRDAHAELRLMNQRIELEVRAAALRAALPPPPDPPVVARTSVGADVARAGHGREVAHATGGVRGLRQVRDRRGPVPASGLRSRGAVATHRASRPPWPP